MEHKAQWIFYKSIGADIPYQKNFFSYSPTSSNHDVQALPSLVWGEEIGSASYEKEFPSQVVIALNIFFTICKGIPFLEQLFIAGASTFGKEGAIDLVVVSNTKRVWIVKILIQLCVGVMNISIKKKSQYYVRMSLCVDRVRSDCGWIRSGVGDLMSAYRIGHLVAVYEEYDQGSKQFFTANRRIQYTIPNHPLFSVISLGLQKTQGVTTLRKWIESIFSGRIGDMINRLIFQIHMIRPDKNYRYEFVSRSSPWVGGERIQSQRALLKRKVSQKKTTDS